MLSTKFAAFTIIELLTVLFISTLVFGAILLVFQITQQQQQQQTKDYNEVLAIEQAKVLLQQDAYNSSSLFRADKSLQCFHPTYQVEYQFEKSYLLRTIKHSIQHTDTLWLPTIELESKWQGQKTTLGQIDLLSWETKFFEQPFRLLIHKEYTTQPIPNH
jgi:competence protein ComGC